MHASYACIGQWYNVVDARIDLRVEIGARRTCLTQNGNTTCESVRPRELKASYFVRTILRGPVAQQLISQAKQRLGLPLQRSLYDRRPYIPSFAHLWQLTLLIEVPVFLLMCQCSQNGYEPS